MEITVSQVAFAVLALSVVVFSILTVATRRILRSATYLLFVLFSTAGLYLLLDYHFLAAVQLTVYAGGIMVLVIFAIFLTGHAGQKVDKLPAKKHLAGLTAAFAGLALCVVVILKNAGQWQAVASTEGEVDMSVIGNALMGTGKFQYLLPFEAISILLLACIIGGILIARKR